MKNAEIYLNRASDIFNSVYSDGYTDGFNKAKEEYGQEKELRTAIEQRLKKLISTVSNFMDGVIVENR